MELVSLALSFKLYELDRGAMVVMSVTRNDSWTFVTGEGEGSGKIIASSVDMDRKFEESCPRLSVDHDRDGLDFWDFKGISLSSDLTPRQMGMVEEDIN